MAFDDSPPRNGLILMYAAITVVTLVALDFALRSYYEAQVAHAKQNALATPAQLQQLRQAAAAELKSGPVTLPDAMDRFASTPREQLGAIAPKASSELDALRGWVAKKPCGPDGRCTQSFRLPAQPAGAPAASGVAPTAAPQRSGESDPSSSVNR
jgi:hypothetical protein